MSANNERFLQNHCLFRECLEALNAYMIPQTESELIGNTFENTFPNQMYYN